MLGAELFLDLYSCELFPLPSSVTPHLGQLTLQDLPEVPSAAPSAENVEEKLDLPDVPTKSPVITEAVMEDAQDTSAGVAVQKKGYCSFLPYSDTLTHTQ